MPCRDYMDDVVYEKDPALAKEVVKLRELLCNAGRAWVNNENPSMEVIRWWFEHSQHDAENGEPWT